MFFLSGLENTCGSHGVLADTWDADWTARSKKVLQSCGQLEVTVFRLDEHGR